MSSFIQAEEFSSLQEELLPGIPNDMTMASIAPKLTYASLSLLYSASPTWETVIRTREVYRERTRSNSTENLIAIKHIDDEFPNFPKHAISLYSSTRNAFYQLPPLPNLEGMSRFSEMAAAHGMLYVLRADSQCECLSCSQSIWDEEADVPCEGQRVDKKLFVMDLAAHGPWEECTPQLNEALKSLLRSSKSMQGPVNASQFTLDSTRFSRGGRADLYTSFWVRSESAESQAEEEKPVHHLVSSSQALELDALPDKDFIIEGKMYSISRADNTGRNHTIFSWDETRKWAAKHNVSSAGVDEIDGHILMALGLDDPPGPEDSLQLDPVFILPIGKELFAISLCKTRELSGFIAVQSVGFGSQSHQIVWQALSKFLRFDPKSILAMCPIQL